MKQFCEELAIRTKSGPVSYRKVEVETICKKLAVEPVLSPDFAQMSLFSEKNHFYAETTRVEVSKGIKNIKLQPSIVFYEKYLNETIFVKN
eukprot:snap_masked-scaffold_4-processed-gene-13.27-mRNA-1 protein AED:1.00 eAED:1.00 QI:0/0/0/0/1/1/2/0/90